MSIYHLLHDFGKTQPCRVGKTESISNRVSGKDVCPPKPKSLLLTQPEQLSIFLHPTLKATYASLGRD